MLQLIINDLNAIMVSILIAGIFSCIILDILGYLQKMIGIPEPSWSVLGRWGYYMIKNGILFNPKIDEMPKYKYELIFGWIFHYLISICWSVIYYISFIPLGIKMSYFSGFIFGIITTLAPLLIFLPFTGQGIFGINTGKPMQISIVFLVRHSIYGIAIYEAFRWFN